MCWLTLSSAKCLNIRHKDSFIPSSLRIWDFDGRIAKCAWFWWWVLFHFWLRSTIPQSSEKENFHIPYDLEMLKIILWKIWIFFSKRAVLRPSTKNRAGPHSFSELIRIFFSENSCLFRKNSSQEWGPVFLQTVDRFYFSLVSLLMLSTELNPESSAT